MNTLMPSELTNISAAWQKRSNWLSRWALARLVNRTDLWARYLPVEKRRPVSDGEPVITRLAPARDKRGVLQLSDRTLIRHYCGEDPGHLIGLHSASVNNQSNWMAINLERHNGHITPLDNLRAVSHWKDELIEMGFHPLLLDTDGAGGYCLIVLFREPLPTARVFDFVRTLVGDYADVGMSEPPAILPNSPVADPKNWLRLPGRHPLVDHWSRVWNGHQWLEGADAVESLLGAHGDSPLLVRKLTHSPMNGNPGSGLYAAVPTMPARTPEPVLCDDPRAESHVLAYLLAAGRAGAEQGAMAVVTAAALTVEAFRTQTHRDIFAAMQLCAGHDHRMTQAGIAEEIPVEHRDAAVAAMDELIVENPVDAPAFEKLVIGVARRVGETPTGDSDLQAIVQAWPNLDPAVRHAVATLIHAAGRCTP